MSMMLLKNLERVNKLNINEKLNEIDGLENCCIVIKKGIVELELRNSEDNTMIGFSANDTNEWVPLDRIHALKMLRYNLEKKRQKQLTLIDKVKKEIMNNMREEN